VTSYIPQDGLLGPPVGAERTVDDEATIDDVVEGVVCDVTLEEEIDNTGAVEATLEVVVDNSDDETTDDDTDNGVTSELKLAMSLVEQPDKTISPMTHDNAATSRSKENLDARLWSTHHKLVGKQIPRNHDRITCDSSALHE